jgi:hypothetical protein
VNALAQTIRAALVPTSTNGADVRVLEKLVRGIAMTRSDEIACDKCFERLDWFVEATVAGHGAAEAMPLVQHHLDRCDDCREEFEALLTALSVAA